LFFLFLFKNKMKKKKQHIIPKCYLKDWCDPMTPCGQEPYLWLISKDGKVKRKRAPKKSFTESEMYTIKLPDGRRELIIEDTLSRIEGSFVRIVEEKIKKRLPFSKDERAKLCTFAAAMSVRTKSQQENFRDTFGKLLMPEYAHQIVMSYVLKLMPPMLYQMSLAIFETDDDLGFITSDGPCVLFNPEMYKWPPAYRNPGLGQEKIEVRLPLTPHHLLLFSHSNIRGYLSVPTEFVDEINRIARICCSEYFISWKGDTRPIWFHILEMPNDAWEKQQKKYSKEEI